MVSLKLLNLNEDQPSKKWFFWSNPYKNEVMITFLIEMLVTKLWSHDHIYKLSHMSFQNFLGDVIKRPGVAIFSDLVKIVTMFIKNSY